MLYGPLCLPKHTSARQIDIQNPVSKSCSPAPLHASMRMIVIILERERYSYISYATSGKTGERVILAANLWWAEGEGEKESSQQQACRRVTSDHNQSIISMSACTVVDGRGRVIRLCLGVAPPQRERGSTLPWPSPNLILTPCPVVLFNALSHILYSLHFVCLPSRESEHDTHPGLLADGSP